MFSQLKQCLYVFVLFFIVNSSDVTAQINVVTRNWVANDIVYDRHRDVIYATVGSSAGPPNENSIIVLDPNTLSIVKRIFVGEGPNKLAISSDSSRVYVGLDGVNSLRYYEPGTGLLGPLQPVRGRPLSSTTGGNPGVVQDMVVSPTDPKVVVVSVEERYYPTNIEVFDDTGKIGGLIGGANAGYVPNSIAFVDDSTLIGFQNENTGFDATRSRFENDQLFFEARRRAPISGFGATIEASGGLIFSTSGEVLDPSTLTKVGEFFQRNSGAVEAIVEDGLVYYAIDKYPTTALTVYDTTTFQFVDSYPVSSLQGAKTLDFAGEGHLAFVTVDGTVGVISFEIPTPVINLTGTTGEDHLLFDLGSREFTLNGTTTSVPADVTKFRFNGYGGQDVVRYIGDGSESELAVLRSDFFSVAADDFSFSARNCNDVEFVSDSDDDIAIFFDSVDADEVFVTPDKIVLENNLAKLVATSVARGYVYSQGGDDNISFRGGLEKEILVANAEQRRISLRNQNFSVTSRGFLNAQVNAGTRFDAGWVVGSSGDDYYYALGNYGYLFNDAGIAYRFKEIESMNVRSESGNDVGLLQQTADSTVRGNSVWSSMSGPGFGHSLSNFHRVVVKEE